MLKVVELFAGVGGFRIGLEATKKFKVISTGRSLGIFIKDTGELVVLDEDAVNAISARFN